MAQSVNVTLLAKHHARMKVILILMMTVMMMMEVVVVVVEVVTMKTAIMVLMVRARRTIIRTGQDYPTGNSSRRETKRQTEETMGRQHQSGFEWNIILRKAENREERRKLAVRSTVVSQTTR